MAPITLSAQKKRFAHVLDIALGNCGVSMNNLVPAKKIVKLNLVEIARIENMLLRLRFLISLCHPSCAPTLVLLRYFSFCRFL